MDVWTFARRGKIDGTAVLAATDYLWFSKHASQDRPHRILVSDFHTQLITNGGSYLSGSATYDAASLGDGVGATTTVTVTGAVLGDFVVGVSHSVDVAGITVTGYVSAADTVSVRFQNESGGTLDLASATLRVAVLKKSALGL